MTKGIHRAGWFDRRKLWQQLALLVGVTALPLLLLSALTVDRLAAQERESVRLRLESAARTLALLVENEIDTHVAIASTLALSPSLQRGDLDAFRREATQAMAFVPGSWLSLVRPDGQIVATTLPDSPVPPPKHAALDAVERAFRTKQPQVRDLVPGNLTRQLTAFVEVPVFRDGEPYYSISVALTPARFLALLESQLRENEEVVAILDRERNFVARLPDHHRRIGTPASAGWQEAIARAPSGWTENLTVEGHWSLTGYAATSQGWTAGIALLDRHLNAGFYALLRWWLMGAALMTGLALLGAWLVAHRTSRGMAALAEAAARLGSGKAPGAPLATFDEAAAIARSLDRAAAELKRREALIAEARTGLENEVAKRTAQLEAEMRRREETETALRQMQKMEAIGQLTSGIAHDFNNMLTIIIGNLEAIERRVVAEADPARILRSVESAMSGARSAAQLTHRLLAFSRQQPLEPAICDLDKVVDGMSDMLRRTVGENVTLEIAAVPDLWPAFVDANQIETAILNLAINARDAMPGGGRLSIETANVQLDGATGASTGEVPAGPYVMLSVSDTGVGMAPATLERIFEPFFTTKDRGKGTGLGLAMVHGFIRQSGGHVEVSSKEGHGTVVKMYLPRADAMARGTAPAPAAGQAAPTPTPPSGGSETVLVVEDDPAVRDFAAGALLDLGYRVVTAEGVDDAHAVVDGGERIDLLFTDVILGGPQTGRDLAEALRRARPDLPVLFTSGYVQDAIVHDGRLDPGVVLLSKPYTLRELADKVRAVLDAASAQRRQSG